MKKFVLAIAIVAMISVQCKNQKTLVVTQPLRSTINTNTFASEEDEADFTVKSASLSGSILTIVVSYKGAKEGNEFDLLWNGSLMKSLPPKASLVLVHKSKDNSGKKNVELTMTFSLDVIAEKTVSNSDVVLMIKGYNENLMWSK